MKYDWLAPVVRSVIAPPWAIWEQSPYLRHYKVLRKKQFDTPDVIRKRQFEQLSDLVHHAYETVPFWKQRFDEQGIKPEEIQSLEDLERLPLLTKQDLRSSLESMMSDKYQNQVLRIKTTSGSTGVSLEVRVDEEAMQFKRACTLRSDEWSGWRFGQRKAMVWGNPEYLNRGWRGHLRNSLLERCVYLDTLKMNENSLESFLNKLEQTHPALLFGHAHSLYLFAQFVESRGGTEYQPRGIISTAMVLHRWEREKIEQVFDCPVTNRYGCEEVSMIACECEQHAGLHVIADNVYVEVLREDGTPASPGEAGMIVVTDLVNRAMPLLRYQVGDMAVVSDKTCACGRGLPLLDRIEGRIADYVVTPQGELVSGISLTENFAMLVTGIKQIQIVQETLNSFIFRIVKEEEFNQHSESQIRNLVEERFGSAVDFVCEYVENIPQESSGKFRFCISHVENPFSRRRESLVQ